MIVCIKQRVDSLGFQAGVFFRKAEKPMFKGLCHMNNFKFRLFENELFHIPWVSLSISRLVILIPSKKNIEN